MSQLVIILFLEFLEMSQLRGRSLDEIDEPQRVGELPQEFNIQLIAQMRGNLN
jgi:hypothetical protein